ncbi:MAG: hypothetical protein HOD90_13030 [Nitrospina sp.]|jgi:hypothetical protein|nr:hypothetical protein [Nitrospina sp.]
MKVPCKDISLSQKNFIWWFWWIIAGLIVMHLTLQAVHYYVQELPWLLREIFDVDEEESFSTWFSAVLLLICSALLFLIARSKVKETYVRHWYGLAMGFGILSLDEVVGMHETFNTITEIAWTVPATWITLLLLLLYLKFLIYLPRPAMKLFLIAGTVFLSGGLLVEHLADYYVEVFGMDNFGYQLLTALEESLEMVGVVLFIRALLKFLAADNTDTVTIKINI